MRRPAVFFVAFLLAVTPTVDVVCRAFCTPDTPAATAPVCHEVATSAAERSLLSSVSCHHRAEAAVAAADAPRNLVPPAPLARVQVLEIVGATTNGRADITRQEVRRRPPQACPSTVVLRI